MSTGIDSIEFNSKGKTVTIDRDEMDGVMEHLKRAADLDFDARIWDRFRDAVNEYYAQVSGGTRRSGKVALAAAVGLDGDGVPCVKLALDQGSKRVGVWLRDEGGQLTMEGL